jgi:hypothetical protein
MEVHFVGYLYIMNLINARRVKHAHDRTWQYAKLITY